MKYLKLKLRNFIPYYEKTKKKQEVSLFDKERGDKKITLNVGPTGHGKTSISEAILWCIFGDKYSQDWDEWVNTLAIEIAEQKSEEEVLMGVELTLDIDGEMYRVIRNGTYNHETEDKANDLTIVHDGEPLDNPNEFISKNFPTITLMKYFVFDADDILKSFEDNRKGTIRDHINKLVGVEKLNFLIEALERSIKLYDEERSEVEDQIDSDLSEKSKEKKADRAKKIEAAKKLREEIKVLKSEGKKLFKGKPSGEVKKLSDLVDQRESLENSIKELNEKFKGSGLLSEMDLLLLRDIVKEVSDKLEVSPTCKNEFERSSMIVRSSLGGKYHGIYFDKENTRLIKKTATIPSRQLEGSEKLKLREGEGTKGDSLKVFQDCRSQTDKGYRSFMDLKKDLDDERDQLLRVRSDISQIGETSKNKELVDKWKELQKIDKKIEQKKSVLEMTESRVEDLDKEIASLGQDMKKDTELKDGLDDIDERAEFTETLLEASRRTRSEFLEELLNTVNKTSSEFLRAIVKDKNRFHSIEIDSDYRFTVKRKNGKPLSEKQINKGNLQISLMSFFFGLSGWLDWQIPYVIDDPLLRLDPGHDKRLIEQLSRTNDQLIFHMIPGKEYSTDNYRWLASHINTQNWVNRRKEAIGRVSYIEKQEPDSMIKWDVEDL
jgi:DNA sulfur modification protein DndD